MKKLTVAVLTALVLIPFLASPAFADSKRIAGDWHASDPTAAAPVVSAPSVSTPERFDSYVDTVSKAVSAGRWGLVAALAVVGLVWTARKWGGRYWPALRTDRGGAGLALALSFATVAAGYIAAGRAWTPQLVFDGIIVAVTAAGGFGLVKKLIAPSDAGATP